MTCALEPVQRFGNVGKRRHLCRHRAAGRLEKFGERPEVVGQRVDHRETDRGLELVLLRARVEERAVEIEQDQRHCGPVPVLVG